MKLRYLDDELGGLILKHKAINKSELANKYNVDRRTIARHINKMEKPPNRKLRSCGLLNYYEIIKNKLEEESNLRSIYMYLLNISTIKEIGTYSNFKQYVIKHFNDIRVARKEKIAKFRYETMPGDQLQFDWIEGIHLHLKKGQLIDFNLWSASLKYSRRHIFKVVKHLTEVDFKRCFIETIIILGGTPTRALTDNMSAIVNINKGKKTIHPTVVQFMKDINVELNLCKVRHPYTKGTVEVSNKYQYWLNAYDFKFETEADLYKGVEEILEQCNYQENSETKVAPIVLFESEKKHLKPLPNMNILKTYHSNLIPIKANISSLITYGGAKYGVPSKYANTQVLISEIDNTVQIFDNKLKLLSTYPKVNYGIHYATGLYSIAKRKNETEEEYKVRIENNLSQLAKLGLKNKEVIQNG